MAAHQGSRRTKAEQWLFGMRWRGTAKETRHTVIPEARPPNPNTIDKDEGMCLEKSRVHLHGPGQRETLDVVPGRRSDVAKTIEKDEGIWLEKSRLYLHGPGRRGAMDIVPGRRSDVAKTIEQDEYICLEKSKVYLHGPGQRETMGIVPGRRSDVAKIIEKDEGICLEKSRVYLHGTGRRATMDIVPGRRSDVAPGRRSMPEMEINIKEVVAVLGVRVMAADMPPFMQLHAFRCAKGSFDSLDKFSSRQLAHDVKKEFDKVYGPQWHCIVGTSFGSFVTHSRGCFLYFSMDKIIVMLFKTKIREVLAS